MRPGSDSLSKMMRDQWNERARINANYYIKSDFKDWSPEDYFKSGAADVHRLLDAPLKHKGIDPKQMTLLEIGCGNGRMTRELSRLFKSVHGVDVSEHMIEQAKENLRDVEQTHLFIGNGIDLNMFGDAMFDYCFSYIVFQHLPTRVIAFGYLEEIYRTLKPGGIARLQFNGYWRTLLERHPKKYLVRFLGSLGIKRTSYRMKGYFDTWVGVYIPKNLMRNEMLRVGFRDVSIDDWGGTDVWVEGTKPSMKPA